MRHAGTRPSLPIVALVLLAACGAERKAPEPKETAATTEAPAAHEVTIRARDMAFTAPAEIPAGRVTIRFFNDGPELHHVQLLKFGEGKTLADFGKALQSGNWPKWATEVGGPNLGAPEGSVGTLDLEPGNYALVCFIDTPDHVPHIMKGMAQPLVVTPSTAPAPAPLPPADLTVTLDSYTFDFSDSITAGPKEVDVVVQGDQPHEIVIVRLDPGQTVEGLMQWGATYKGPLPAVPVAGTTAIAPGGKQRMSVDFKPGNYVLLCFIPDKGDRKPHVAHGMVKTFTVS